MKSTYNQVVGIEESNVLIGSEKLLLFAHADVLAGIELPLRKPGDGRILTARRVDVLLPRPKIVPVIIDDKWTDVPGPPHYLVDPGAPFNPELELQAVSLPATQLKQPPAKWEFSIRRATTPKQHSKLADGPLPKSGNG